SLASRISTAATASPTVHEGCGRAEGSRPSSRAGARQLATCHLDLTVALLERQGGAPVFVLHQEALDRAEEDLQLLAGAGRQVHAQDARVVEAKEQRAPVFGAHAQQ